MLSVVDLCIVQLANRLMLYKYDTYCHVYLLVDGHISLFVTCSPDHCAGPYCLPVPSTLSC